MNAPLDPAILRKAKSAAALLASSQAGERQAAMSALDRLMPGALAGLVLKALEGAGAGASMPADPYGRASRKARTILGSAMPLTTWERGFLASIAEGRKAPTARQAQALDKIGVSFAAWEARNG